MCVLDGVNVCSLVGFGCVSFPGVSYTGFTDGDPLWDLSMGRLTGGGNLMGRHFWVGCGCFLLGGSGGAREIVRERSAGSVFAGRHTLSNNPIFVCCILYIEQWGFHYFIFQDISTMWGPPTLRSVTDSTEQLVWCIFLVCVTCSFCYMLFNSLLYLHIILL
jgi:hypothetical protein